MEINGDFAQLVPYLSMSKPLFLNRSSCWWLNDCWYTRESDDDSDERKGESRIASIIGSDIIDTKIVLKMNIVYNASSDYSLQHFDSTKQVDCINTEHMSQDNTQPS